MSESNNMVIGKVQNENERLEGFSLDHRSEVKVHVIDHTHGNPVGPRWVELNAGYALAFTIIVIDESPRSHISSIDFASCGCLVISEHLEVVLEHIDDLIGLESLFNSEGHAVDEFI